VTRLLTENPGWKLLALAISALLWYAFVGETELAASLPAAVQFKNVPQDLEVSAETLDRVFVRLKGPATRLNAGSLRDVTVVLDLSQVNGPGERSYTLSGDNLQLPAGVEVSRIVPSQMRLRFEKRITRDIPIEIRFAGPPHAGYRITGHEALPQKVRVTGPENRVEALQSVQTDAIDLSSTVGNAEFRVPAFVPDPHVRFDGNPPTITVRVFMQKVPQ
jgi:YbbR domain-containing protein